MMINFAFPQWAKNELNLYKDQQFATKQDQGLGRYDDQITILPLGY